MKSAIVSIGTEILHNIIKNTNVVWLREQLSSMGFTTPMCIEVADDAKAIKKALQVSLEEADLVIITGGLGPTDDDFTRNVASEFFSLPLKFHPDLIPEMEEKFLKRGIKMPEENKNQAYIPDGATVIPNPTGTAPGFIVEQSGKLAVFLPGVPKEMKPMFLNSVIPIVKKHFPTSQQIQSVLVRTVGIPESQLDEEMKTLKLPENVSYGTVAHYGQVDIRFLVKGEPEHKAKETVAGLMEKVSFKDSIFTIGDESLVEVLGKTLTEKGLTCATAESCTAGLTAKMLTDVPGSSSYFAGGVVSYSNELKRNILGVSKSTLEKYGAVSEETAVEMLEGVKKLTKSDVAVSITGIAGPSGGTPEKPVGLVWFAVSSPSNQITTEKHIFNGDREIIRIRAATKAIELMWRKTK